METQLHSPRRKPQPRSASGRFAPTGRCKLTNKPLFKHKGNTVSGRRVRDLYREYSAALGNPTDVTTQAAILAVAELTHICELRREQLMQRGSIVSDRALTNLIRLEGTINRKFKALGLGRKLEKAGPTLYEYLGETAE